jgi:hypothetical protein
VVRLTAEEDRQLAAQADELGLSPAAFLRLAAGKKLPRRRGALDRETQKELWKQVAGMARNLNQLTKYAHTGQLRPGELDEVTRSLQTLVRLVLDMGGGGSRHRDEEAL